MVQESIFYFQTKIPRTHVYRPVSAIAPQSIRPQIPSPAVLPSFWCITCQMSLRNADEELVHVRRFPMHVIRTARRTTCPRCGNGMLLEGGRFPVHWIGYGGDLRKCLGSRMRP